MPAFLFLVLMLGGIATTVAAAVLAAEVEFEAALALAGLLATLGGAVGLVLGRVAGDAPADLRPPGATGRVNLPTAAPRSGAPGRSRSRRGRARPPTSWSGAAAPAMAAIPTGPTPTGISRTPVVLGAFFVGVAWALTNAGTSSGPLDIVAAALLVAAPIALVMAIATRLMVGRAWAPAVTVTLAGISFLLGSVVADMFVSTVG
jgi:hypothetical protein